MCFLSIHLSSVQLNSQLNSIQFTPVGTSIHFNFQFNSNQFKFNAIRSLKSTGHKKVTLRTIQKSPCAAQFSGLSSSHETPHGKNNAQAWPSVWVTLRRFLFCFVVWRKAATASPTTPCQSMSLIFKTSLEASSKAWSLSRAVFDLMFNNAL